MAYITKSTLNLLVESVEDVNNENKKISKEFFLEHIYNYIIMSCYIVF